MAIPNQLNDNYITMFAEFVAIILALDNLGETLLWWHFMNLLVAGSNCFNNVSSVFPLFEVTLTDVSTT